MTKEEKWALIQSMIKEIVEGDKFEAEESVPAALAMIDTVLNFESEEEDGMDLC